METNKFKFKYIKPINKEGWSNKYCKKINFKDESNKLDKTEEISSKLNNIEFILNKLIANKEKDKDKSTDNKVVNNNRAIIKLNPKSSLNYYEDYPKKLIKFYFTMQLYCSYPPVMNLREYFNCNHHFKNKLPLYLTYAILSRSSLNSPIPQLYMKNVEFSNYYYNLSLQDLEKEVSSGKISIYMLHALIILIALDVVLSRSLNISNRLMTCIKLSQMLDLTSHPSISSVQKLQVFLNYLDNDTSQVFNKPKLIRDGIDLNNDDYNINEKDSIEDLVDFNITDGIDLPEDYKLNFEARKNFIYLLFPKVDALERNFNLFSADHSLSECINLLEYISNLYGNLSPIIKYSDDCLNESLIAKNPLLRIKLSFYHTFLRESGRICSLSVKLIPSLESSKVVELVKRVLKFIELPINLLKVQSLELASMPNSKVRLNLSTFFHLSRLLIDLLNALINLKNSADYSPSLRFLERPN
ncbi:hypothetical protein CONCODRAFT_83424 [Conidiobolus coronatus NRRL 28638]|uniref:Transcription factor domain-containing protein n=1 Tax=Conidiobolus coronatus (strain ATCC 28846 / CBS 209.66 / NRRL 28638) TaxID=796925 RepID=A0A137PEW8_CONC2|nr:hypothetical protein CONCODRAFT_83424 [Conidiobolus coronatus NRRL 28638]|eukprot:KXN73512.1 hypothetical protein CONCODRAFT_83424 [Conidiobolus coronatus NRRL 28638]